MNFEKLVMLIESPDMSFGRRYESGSYSFILTPDFIIKSPQNATHSLMMSRLEEELEHSQYIVNTDLEGFYFEDEDGTRFEIDGKIPEGFVGKRYFRREFIQQGFILGRTWFDTKQLSVWNKIEEFDSSIFQRMLDLVPHRSDFICEFGPVQTHFPVTDKLYDQYNIKHYTKVMDFVWGTIPDIQEFLRGRKTNQATYGQEIDALHLLDPSVKSKAMKERGIMPKTPLPLSARYKIRQGD